MVKRSVKTKKQKSKRKVSSALRKKTVFSKWFSRFKPENNAIKIAYVVFFVILLFLGHRQYVIYQQSNDFKRAEAVIKDVVNEFQAEFGETEVDVFKECSHASRKFSKGPLGCILRYSFGDSEKDLGSANYKLAVFSSVLKNNSNIDDSKTTPLKPIEEFRVFDNGISGNASSSFLEIHDVDSLICTTSLSFNVNKGPAGKDNKKDFNVSIDCKTKDTAKTNYFPLAD